MKKWITENKNYECLFICSIIICFVFWIAEIMINGENSLGYGLFFERCNAIFGDSLDVIGYSGDLNPYFNEYTTGLWEKGYPPLSYILMYPLSRLVDISYFNEIHSYYPMYQIPKLLIIYFIINILIYIVYYEIIKRRKKGNEIIKSLTAISFIMSYPILFNIERANLISIAAICYMFFLFFNDSDNRVISEISFISLAISAALKFYPAFAGIILIFDKRFKEAFRTVLYGILASFGPFIFIKGNFIVNLKQLLNNISMNTAAYKGRDGADLFSVFVHLGIPYKEQVYDVTRCISLLLVIVFILGTFFDKKKWERAISITLAIIIAPVNSGDYCLLYLLPIIIMFLNEDRHNVWDFLILISFIIIMAPTVIDYHVGLLLIIIIMTVRDIKNIYSEISNKSNTKLKSETCE